MVLPKKKKFLTGVLSEDLEKIVKRYEKRSAALLPVLHRLQDEYGWISREIETEAAEFLDVPEVKVHEAVSFYSMFHSKKIGKYEILICETLSCTLGGSETLLSFLKKKLGIGLGETTPDGRFTLSTVQCLGACELSPVMQINRDTYGRLTPEKIEEILRRLP